MPVKQELNMITNNIVRTSKARQTAMTVLISISKKTAGRPPQQALSQKASAHQAVPVAIAAANNHLTCLLINSG